MVGQQKRGASTAVFYRNAQGLLVTVPVEWTTLAAPDPAVVAARGRCHFRVDDLLQLTALLGRLSPPGGVT